MVHATAFPYAWPIACGLRLARQLRVPFCVTPFLHLGDPNDPGDPDSGANNGQNYPVITAAGTSGGSTTISGSLNSSPNATFALDFFASTQCDPSLYGEGARFLGTTTVATNASGELLGHLSRC